jgi:hypothetical protein
MIFRVCTQGDNTEAACNVHKRLILEYACDLYPQLMLKKKDIQVCCIVFDECLQENHACLNSFESKIPQQRIHDSIFEFPL